MTATLRSPEASAYEARRNRLQTYFNLTAKDTWAQLTSDAPVSKIRATVRAGRDRMRATLMSWLPRDMHGASLLDAGCGTGALAVATARRGARVLGVDVSAGLIDVAIDRAPRDLDETRLAFHAGDMLDPTHGAFDYVAAMDSLIHYPAAEIVRALGMLADRTRKAIVFTYAPQTPALSLMHAAGKLFPRADRAPAIEPIAERRLRDLIAAEPALSHWSIQRTAQISSGFYISHALELRRG
ncbi:MAG: magnesium protoporphyrin IX methyltransferase [Hyphomonadaceae bacterium]|nr:magnesium protoporphyrin IX methyltransferase [Hyphomonadaceae bacterium]